MSICDINFDSNVFLARFIRVTVGKEAELVDTLKASSPSGRYYKVFGKYDILEISLLDDLHEAIRTNTNSNIKSLNCIPCFCIDADPVATWDRIHTSPAPALCLLKLHEDVFTKHGLNGIQAVAEKLVNMKKEAIPLVGMGYYEILLWLPVSDIDDIFTFAEEIRGLAFANINGIETIDEREKGKGVFVETNTIPMVSYEHVITPKKWDLLAGSVLPSVKVRCAPGQESLVLSKWNLNWRQILGAEDLGHTWFEPIGYGEFVSSLIDFRNNWTTSNIVVDTATRLVNKLSYKPASETTCDPEDTGYTRGLFEELRTLTLNPGINKVIIGEVINCVSIINTNISNRGLKSTYSDIMFSMLFNLNSLIDEYNSVISSEDISKKTSLEGFFFAYVNCINAAVLQHFPYKDFGDTNDSLSRLSYAGSLSRIVKGISVIAESLFELISKSTYPDCMLRYYDQNRSDREIEQALVTYNMPWKGFLFLNMNTGYHILNQNEVITVPFEDIFNILNWCTLSHEVSHGYYQRIRFEVLEAKWIAQRTKNMNSEDSIAALFIGDFGEYLYELFAHWFDYKHFYSSDIDFYMWSIWRTWFGVSRIFKHKTNYWIRTVFVYFCHNYKNFYEIVSDRSLSQEQINLFAFEALKEMYEKVDDFLKSKFDKEYENIKLNIEEIDHVIKSLVFVMPAYKKFENNYINRELIMSVEAEYPELNDHIKLILSGKVIQDRVSNPLVLVREILRMVYLGEITNVSGKSALALILSFWETSRFYERPIDEYMVSA